MHTESTSIIRYSRKGIQQMLRSLRMLNAIIPSSTWRDGRSQNSRTVKLSRDTILSTAAANRAQEGARRRNKFVGAIFLDVARAFVTNGFREISESSFLPRARAMENRRGGRRDEGLLLINRVSSAVRYIHYLAPATHLFRRPIYLF